MDRAPDHEELIEMDIRAEVARQFKAAQSDDELREQRRKITKESLESQHREKERPQDEKKGD